MLYPSKKRLWSNISQILSRSGRVDPTSLLCRREEVAIAMQCDFHRPQLIVFINPFQSYVGPRPTLWFFCSRLFSWSLTLSNPIFLPPAYSPALIYFGRERGWWITCNYPTVLKEKNRNRKSTTCTICWLKSVLHEEKCREQENHNVGQSPTLWVSSLLTLFLM
jgi:hypothetical protein